MVRFTTLNSTYEISDGTWRRTANNGIVDPLIPLRTEEGEVWEHTEPTIGMPVTITGPPLVEEGADVRVIITSDVVSIP